LAAAVTLALGGCASTPRTNPEVVAQLFDDGSVPIERQLGLTVETVDAPLKAEAEPYRIGVNDRIHVSVVGHVELSGAGAQGEGQLVGYRVQGDGKVYPPMLDGVAAAGRTVPELRTALIEEYARYIKEPKLSVDLLGYESQKFYVLGKVRTPGAFPVNGSVTLLDGVAGAGGILDDGDIEGAYVIRRGQLLPVSLGDILLRGETARNVRMVDGDLVYVPDKTDWKVYVLGEVRQPGTVPMGGRGLNLIEALAYVGGVDPVHADQRKVRIFRGSWQHPQAFTLSTEDAYRYGPSIHLRPGDRIIVAPRPLATYSRVLNLATPFLQTASTAAVLTATVTD
jgi:polysaccharide export outer membrane protein